MQLEYDVIVVGGGPAGMTAALYAARAAKRVLLAEGAGFGGQISHSPRVENYPGVEPQSGSALAAAMADQLAAQEVEFGFAAATGARAVPGGFEVLAEGEAWRGKSLVLAPGMEHRCLGLAGEDGIAGISYCAVCDGAFYKGRKVAVVGGGDTALQDALLLAELCGHVTLIHRRGELRGAAALAKRLRSRPNVEFLLNTAVTAFESEAGRLTGLAVKNTADASTGRLAVDGVFLAVGQTPGTAPFAGFVVLDEQGFVLAGEDCRTSRPGVFAAGDCRTKQVRQLATAVGDGAVAGLAASEWAAGAQD